MCGYPDMHGGLDSCLHVFSTNPVQSDTLSSGEHCLCLPVAVLGKCVYVQEVILPWVTGAGVSVCYSS